MSGVILAVAGSLGANPIRLLGATESAFGIPPATAGAGYQLTSGGKEQSGTGTAASISYTNLGDWVTPTTDAGLYEVRATVNSGAVSSGTTGSWLALTSSRAWTVTRSVIGLSQVSLTIEVRRASDSVVVASTTVLLSAELT